jgi:hypothetical protein
MSDKTKQHEQEVEWQIYHDQSMKNWRAWGSWFSWGSPIGLGLFFLMVAGTIWILFQI